MGSTSTAAVPEAVPSKRTTPVKDVDADCDGVAVGDCDGVAAVEGVTLWVTDGVSVTEGD